MGEAGSSPDGRPFQTTSEIVAALKRAQDFYDPVTSSLLILRKNGGSRNDEPFHRGFLGTFEERAYLLQLLRVIDERSRILLILWFSGNVPVAQIARRLHLSRVHCYRIKDRALSKLLKASKANSAPASQHERQYQHSYQAQAVAGA